MEVYVDDMLVKSKTADSHLHNISLMFRVLKKYKMRLNPSKCAFGVSSGKFLGFMISQRGIEDNPDKIKALLDMQTPKTQKDIQSLTGRVAALARFISKATDRCAPFFKALKGSKRQIVWIAECDRAFQDLKVYMSRAPLLSTPLPGEDLILYLSVSATALSSVLIRKSNGIELPIFYTSHALQDAEIRYPELKKLTYAHILPARKLRPYFQAHSIVVLTNQPLRQILQRPETSGRLVKWAIELSEFDIRYHPRPAEKGQAVADFISELTTSDKGGPADIALEPPSTASASHPTEGTFNPSIPLWTLYVDGSSNRQGSGAGLVLKAPDQTTIEYAIRFQFPASNNEVEYEALLAGLRLAREMGAQQLKVCSDSQLVVNQILTQFEAKDTSMAAYLTHARRLLHHFPAYQVQQIPRSENSHADALSRLASAIDDNIDGSSNRQGSGAGLVLKAPDQTTIEYAIRFQFPASNNEVEYEALLAGLRLAREMGAQQLKVCSDSQLVVNQILTQFEAKDTSMAAYLTHARRLLHHFPAYQVQQIPRSENSHADALSRLASAIDDNIGRHVPIEILSRRSTADTE
ncbi:uncharacterized protein LOC110746996, partial [Prunus avium]|uniref:Uncharacterized protein LOC110746996 n=1 Tax=Prunus avium TaxID=42229 RepID=A0A6P5RDC7_PRUAV